MPISTPLDDNGIPTLIGTLDTNGRTPVSVKADPITHGLKINDGTTGSSFTATTSQRDANRHTALWAVSSADGITPIYVATDVNGNLLVKST